MKSRGNELFKAKDYKNSILAYNAALNLVVTPSTASALTAISDSSSSSKDSDQIALYSNLAACYLKTGQLMLAKRAVESCLSLDSLHVKALYRKAEVMSGLRRYTEALVIQKTLFHRKHISEEEWRVKSEQISAKVNQLAYAEYDFAAITTSLFSDVESYYGPIEVRQTADHKGRGLFATRDIAENEKLIVETAFVWSFESADHNSNRELLCMTNSATSVRKSQTQADCLTKAVIKVTHSKLANYRLSTLCDGVTSNERVPNMLLFRCDDEDLIAACHSDFHTTPTMSAQQIDATLAINQFSAGGIVTKQGDEPTNGTAVWLVSSFMNHTENMKRNTERRSFGNVMIVIAKNAIAKGEELLTTYVDSGDIVSDMKTLSLWGIGSN